MSDLIEQALEILLSSEVEPIVDMVLRSTGADAYEALAHDGRAAFTRRADGNEWSFAVTTVEGRDPLADQDADRFAGLDAELAVRYPHRTANSYPNGYEQVAQLFDSPDAPDLCIVEQQVVRIEVDVVQARAPFILAGRGVRCLGRVPRHCRLSDVAPTVMAVLGAEPVAGGVGKSGLPRAGALLARQDGDPQSDLLDGEPAGHVVGFLLDGCNPNVLYAMAEAGEAPNVARLMAMGTTYEHGAMSGLPTVTLANHTGILTGCYPGHHGILHNAWYDRAKGEQVITMDVNITWEIK